MTFVNVWVLLSLKHSIVIATDGPFTMLRRPWRKAGRGVDGNSVKRRFCQPLDCYRWWFGLHILFVIIILLLVSKLQQTWFEVKSKRTETVNGGFKDLFMVQIIGSSSRGCGRVPVG